MLNNPLIELLSNARRDMATAVEAASSWEKNAGISLRGKLLSRRALASVAVVLLITALKGHPGVLLDETFGMPVHPAQGELPFIPAQSLIATVAMFLVGLTGVVLVLQP